MTIKKVNYYMGQKYKSSWMSYHSFLLTGHALYNEKDLENLFLKLSNYHTNVALIK